jgi:NAD(P)-dependent dehydrogenase (short-subunit alcohol dehydrogenase family)
VSPGDPAARLDLSGRVVVVAGAGGGGIGTAICKMLAEAGASIAALDVREEALALVSDAVAGTPGTHRNLVVDVRDPDAVERAVTAATDQGPLHGLVHVAGGLFPDQWTPLVDLDLAVFDQVLDLNLRAALATSQSVARRLIAQGGGGSIVAISSVAGLTAMPFGVGYSASKAAMLALVRTAAIEWGPHDIRVNSVAPGTVRTPKSQRGAPAGADQDTPEERAVLPLGHRGHPDDIAGAVLFLLSDLAGWVTGQVLAVDGGSSIRPSFLGADNIPVFVRDQAMRARLLG